MQLHGNRVTPCNDEEGKDGESKNSKDSSTQSQYESIMHALHYDGKWQEEVNLGVRVGLYRIRGELGSGNFSRVKLAVHQLTKENVAIKMVDKGKLDEKTRRMLQQEIAAMEKVHHPNIIRLYEVMDTYSKVYIAMEYARGGELFNKVTTTGRFEEALARYIFAQISSAVQHLEANQNASSIVGQTLYKWTLHDKLIIHRDIKAENVFLSTMNRVKLGDFGFCAQLTDPDEPLNMFCGSPPYAAPELFRDEVYVGAPVDVWALGVLLYFLLVGRMPFRGHNVPTIKTHILAGDFQIPRFLSQEVSKLLEKILVQTPSERPSVSDILATEWLSGIAPTPTCETSQSYILQPTVLPYKPPTQVTEDVKYSQVEMTARERLETLGINSSLLAAHASQGSRSHVIGCYRIVVHRVERHLLSFAKAEAEIPGLPGTPTETDQVGLCGAAAACWGKRKRRQEGTSTKTCTVQ